MLHQYELVGHLWILNDGGVTLHLEPPQLEAVQIREIISHTERMDIKSSEEALFKKNAEIIFITSDDGSGCGIMLS